MYRNKHTLKSWGQSNVLKEWDHSHFSLCPWNALKKQVFGAGALQSVRKHQCLRRFKCMEDSCIFLLFWPFLDLLNKAFFPRVGSRAACQGSGWVCLPGVRKAVLPGRAAETLGTGLGCSQVWRERRERKWWLWVSMSHLVPMRMKTEVCAFFFLSLSLFKFFLFFWVSIVWTSLGMKGNNWLNGRCLLSFKPTFQAGCAWASLGLSDLHSLVLRR